MVLSNGAWKYIPLIPTPTELEVMDRIGREMMQAGGKVQMVDEILALLSPTRRPHLTPDEAALQVEVTPWGARRIAALVERVTTRIIATAGEEEEEEEEEEEDE